MELIKNILFKSYSNNFENQVKSDLLSANAVLIKNLPLSNEILVKLSKSLGNIPLVPNWKLKANVEDSFIYRVELNSKPLKDKYGFDILSTTNKIFHLHTDDFAKLEPSNIVLFHCWENSNFGGNSTFINIRTIKSKIPDKFLNILQQKIFFTPIGLVSCLYNEDYIRYNRYDIDRFAEISNHNYDKNVLDALSFFDNLIEKEKFVLKLNKNDCLIFRNDIYLHGRTEFSENGKRLIKRIRLNLK